MELPLENKIHKNNINVSIHWVQIHVKIFRKEIFLTIFTILTICEVCGKQAHYSPLMP